jgi:hypothetical protein
MLSLTLGFFIMTIIALFVIKTKKQKDIVLTILCSYLLIYKTIEHIYLFATGVKTVIVELSTISYFLLTIVYLFKVKSLAQFSVFCAFVSGFFYIFSFIFFKNNFIYKSVFDRYITCFNHSILYFGSILQLKYNKYDRSKYYTLFLGFWGIILYSFIIKQIVYFEVPVLIFQLMNGSLIFSIIPKLKNFALFFPLYYATAVALIFSLIWVFYKINRILYFKYIKKEYFNRKNYIENIDLQKN